MNQHYTGEHCPKCMDGRSVVDVDFETEHVGVLGHHAGQFECSKDDCNFEAPLVDTTNQLFTITEDLRPIEEKMIDRENMTTRWARGGVAEFPDWRNRQPLD